MIALTPSALTEHTRADLERALHLITAHTPGTTPNAATIAEIVVALRDTRIVDVMFALSQSTHRAAAESMWWHMIARVPDPDRAVPALLLAHSLYLRRKFTQSRRFAHLAHISAPDHKLSTLIVIAIGTAVPRAQMRLLATSGCEAAAELGVHPATLGYRPLPGVSA